MMSWAVNKLPATLLRLLALERECFEPCGRDGQVLLAWAIEKGHQDVVNRLLEKRAKTDVKASELL